MKRFKHQDFINELASGNLYGVFIDDTGSPGLSSTPTHLHPGRKSWVGIIVPPHQMKEVMEQFVSALDELQKLTGAKEFHFADIYSGKKEFDKKRVDLQVRLALFRFMAYVFTVYEFPVFVQTFDPDTLNDIRVRGGFPDNVVHFNMNKHEDAALLFLLIRIKWYLAQNGEKTLARVFVDEGYKKHGVALYMPTWKSVFSDGLICFARSSAVHPIQLADFAAFCLNRGQLLFGKNVLSQLDKELLQIISPIAWNYQNIEKRIVDFGKWEHRFGAVDPDA